MAEQVEGQRKSTSALILQYYYARLAQQTEPDLPTLAHVLVRVNVLPLNEHLQDFIARVWKLRDKDIPSILNPSCDI